LYRAILTGYCLQGIFKDTYFLPLFFHITQNIFYGKDFFTEIFLTATRGFEIHCKRILNLDATKIKSLVWENFQSKYSLNFSYIVLEIITL